MKKILTAVAVFSLLLIFAGCSKDEGSSNSNVEISFSELKKSGAKKDITSMEELSESIMNLGQDPVFSNVFKMLSYAEHPEKTVYLASYSSRRNNRKSSYDSKQEAKDFLVENVLGEDFVKKFEKFQRDVMENGKASFDYSRKEKVLFKMNGVEVKDYYLKINGKANSEKQAVKGDYKLKFTMAFDPNEVAEDSAVKDLLFKINTSGSANMKNIDNKDKTDGNVDLFASLVEAVSFVDPKTERGGILTISVSVNPDFNLLKVKNLYEKKDPREASKETFKFVKPVLIIEMKNDEGVTTFKRECRKFDDFEKLEKEVEEMKDKISAASNSFSDSYSDYSDMNYDQFDYDYSLPEYDYSDYGYNF